MHIWNTFLLRRLKPENFSLLMCCSLAKSIAMWCAFLTDGGFWILLLMVPRSFLTDVRSSPSTDTEPMRFLTPLLVRKHLNARRKTAEKIYWFHLAFYEMAAVLFPVLFRDLVEMLLFGFPGLSLTLVPSVSDTWEESFLCACYDFIFLSSSVTCEYGILSYKAW